MDKSEEQGVGSTDAAPFARALEKVVLRTQQQQAEIGRWAWVSSVTAAPIVMSQLKYQGAFAPAQWQMDWTAGHVARFLRTAYRDTDNDQNCYFAVRIAGVTLLDTTTMAEAELTERTTVEILRVPMEGHALGPITQAPPMPLGTAMSLL